MSEWDGAERRAESAEEIRRKAMAEFYASLGINANDPRQIEEFRDDLRFMHKLRRVADHSILAFIGVVVAGMAAAVWAGIVTKIKG